MANKPIPGPWAGSEINKVMRQKQAQAWAGAEDGNAGKTKSIGGGKPGPRMAPKPIKPMPIKASIPDYRRQAIAKRLSK